MAEIEAPDVVTCTVCTYLAAVDVHNQLCHTLQVVTFHLCLLCRTQRGFVSHSLNLCRTYALCVCHQMCLDASLEWSRSVSRALSLQALDYSTIVMRSICFPSIEESMINQKWSYCIGMLVLSYFM